MVDEKMELVVQFNAVPGTIENEFFPRLEEWIQTVTAPYKGQLVTEETLAKSKDDLADLRKALDRLETERKRIKKLWQKPYEEWETRYKDAITGLTSAIDGIDIQVKKFTQAQKEQREQSIKDAILKDARDMECELFVQNPEVWARVYRPEYANKSYSQNKATMEWRQALSQIMRDLKTIGDDEALLTAYAHTGNLADAMLQVKEDKARNEEYLRKSAPVETKPEPVDEEPILKGFREITFNIADPESYPEDERKIVAMTRSYKGPKYKLLLLARIAEEELGLEVRRVEK